MGGHTETAQGTRFTVGPEARIEVLDRLLELNHERHVEELRLGLGATKPKRPHTRAGASSLWEEPA